MILFTKSQFSNLYNFFLIADAKMNSASFLAGLSEICEQFCNDGDRTANGLPVVAKEVCLNNIDSFQSVSDRTPQVHNLA